MAILFFDGFDRCTVTKNFDQNYWSFQPYLPVEYKKYAFGGYSYNHSLSAYDVPLGYVNGFWSNPTGYYMYHSVNGATAPEGVYFSGNPAEESMPTLANYSGNPYPGFGSPPGFLALHNLDISDNNLLAPISYIQLSGFNLPQSGESFLSCRMLGIETKDENYHESDLNGRFGHRHPLVAFCSGNTTGLLVNVIKVTGNHIAEIENKKMTIGLEIVQNEAVSGIFDMNVGNNINKFRIRSLYSREAGSRSGDIGGRILCFDANTSEIVSDYYGNSGEISPISRWTHLQFGIIQTGVSPYPLLKIKLENIDLHAIPEDDTIPDEGSNWNDYISISGFDFDNIRFFNRTYNGSVSFGNHENAAINRYYMLGAVTLLDDVVLSDASGTPSTYLGSSARVIPFSPGISGNINNSGVYPDGLAQWSNNISNTSGNRIAFKNLDGDIGRISSTTSGHITAVRYSNTNYTIPDSGGSSFRFSLEDSIGGIKIYSQGKKEFLDTRYEVVIKTGVSEETNSYMSLGGVQNLTRTRYGDIYQFYQYNNPSNDQPWTTGFIGSPSGFILGVKKL